MKKISLILALLVMAAAAYYFQRKPQVPQSKYPVLSLEVLRSIPDQDLEYAIVDHVSDLIGDDYQNEYKIVMDLPKEIRAVYITWGVDAEVNNGGFNQYFWNSSGQFGHEAIEGYELIGAREHAALLREAVAIYEKEQARLNKYKEKGTVEAFSDSYKDNQLNQLDDRFFKLEDAGAMRVRFIKEHLEAFQSPET